MSAVFAAAGHEVVAFDPDAGVIAGLRDLVLPVEEPGLRETIAAELASGRLRYTHRVADVSGRDIVWISYDTPVDEDGRADADSVIARVVELLPYLTAGTLVVVSSQLPAGSISRLERLARREFAFKRLTFAYSPENLRLGKAIWYLRNVDRFVVGVRTAADEERVREAYRPLTTSIEAMSVESAEVTKHAVNSFLATSVMFINELAEICERLGADVREVERGLKSDMRIGKLAYLRANGPLGGATLARDVDFLTEIQRKANLRSYVLQSVKEANAHHAGWVQRRFVDVVGEPDGKTIALLGLTYKAGTNTLRGSSAIAFAKWFAERGGNVLAFDPAVTSIPGDLNVELRTTAEDALSGADAVFVATDWPEFRDIPSSTFHAAMKVPIVFDPGSVLYETVGRDRRLRYLTLGVGERLARDSGHA